jgi:hypothetical protein
MSTNHNLQIYGWLEKIQANIEKFKQRLDISDEDRIEFITHQYHLVMIIYRALNGQVIFVGAKPIL